MTDKKRTDDVMAAALKEMKGEPMVPNVSNERTRDEMLKILSSPDPTEALRAMEESGLLSAVLPEATDGAVDRLERMIALEKPAAEIRRAAKRKRTLRTRPR